MSATYGKSKNKLSFKPIAVLMLFGMVVYLVHFGPSVLIKRYKFFL